MYIECVHSVEGILDHTGCISSMFTLWKVYKIILDVYRVCSLCGRHTRSYWMYIEYVHSVEGILDHTGCISSICTPWKVY